MALITNGSPSPATPDFNGPDGENLNLTNLQSVIESANWSPSIWNFATIATLGRPTLVNNPE